jgi:hypothetical protein
LNETSAEGLAIVPVKAELAAPFNEMLTSKNIFVNSSAPNEKLRWITYSSAHLPINELTCAWYFNNAAQIHSFRREEECIRVVPIYTIWRNWPWWASPIHLNSHFSCWRIAAIFPSWENSKASDEKAWIRSISLWQIDDFRKFGICGSRQFYSKTIEKNESSVDHDVLFVPVSDGSPKPISLAGPDKHEQPSENGEPEIRDFGSMTKNYPKLASLIRAFMAIVASSLLQVIGWRRLNMGQRVIGVLLMGLSILLAFSGTVGLLLGLL